MDETIGVMQVIDTLEAGGAERVAVNMANALPRERYESHFCTTRRSGPLAGLLHADVRYFDLHRRWAADWGALRRFRHYIRERDIRILHAHGYAMVLSAAAAWGMAQVRVVAHLHSGPRAAADRRSLPLWCAASRTSAVLAVSEPLADWARRRLGLPAGRVCYLPNFVLESKATPAPDLPGRPGQRVVCVANLRVPKDHETLVRAWAQVAGDFPDARLLLVGAEPDPDYALRIARLEEELGVASQVVHLGQRDDVRAILKACDIGVLVSTAEGFPLALAEYGMEGLATVASNVGQCAEILGHGAVGLLVPPRAPQVLADALHALLRDGARRAELGRRFAERTRVAYGVKTALARLERVYQKVLEQ